jgi:ribosomal protein S18 acetylase RimI-like enzyme
VTSTSETSIRRASIDDAAALAALNEAVQVVHHQALPDEFLPPDSRAAEPFFAEQLAGVDVLAWIAEAGSQPVGYVLAQIIDRPANAFSSARSGLYVHHLAVLDDVRRHGVGRRLMEAVQQEACERGMDDIRLDYWTFNERAKKFFASLGYEPYNERARLRLTQTK